MLNLDDLSHNLASAYEHLYDIAHLRAHPLTALPLPQTPAQGAQTQDRGWQAHHALIKVVEELNPGGRAPAMSREWRRHRLMKLRYVDGLSPQEVADALAISRRQYYRVHDEAMRALAEILLTQQGNASQPDAPAHDQMLRTEIERHGRDSQRASLPVIIDSTLSLLRDRMSQRSLHIDVTMPRALPDLHADEKLFRQLLLSMIGFLAERSSHASLSLVATPAQNAVELMLHIKPPLVEWHSTVATFDELAALSNAHVKPLADAGTLHGFVITQPTLKIQGNPAPVLVVDDNEDTLELYRRYLEPEYMNVSVARNSAEVFDALLDALPRARPQAIFLDLMLPEQDGWDILQLLKNEPDAREIPVFICSVLKQKELALALGATGFIQKPFTKETLLAALEGMR